MIGMNEPRFIRFWEGTIKAGTSAEIVGHWREYVLTGVERARALVKIVEPYVPAAGARVLDVGCGFGGVSIAFSQAGAHVSGIDVMLERLRGAHIRAIEDYGLPYVTLLGAMLEDLPFATQAFDVVICSDVLEHVRSKGASIREITRVLRPGGVAYVSFPNYFSPANLRADPHFQLAGVSVLPPALGEWYVVKVRRAAPDYHVGVLPVAALLARRFHAEGMDVVWQNPLLRRRLGPLTGMARAVLTNSYPLVEWVLRKEA